jgi:hypothetical protein
MSSSDPDEKLSVPPRDRLTLDDLFTLLFGVLVGLEGPEIESVA